MMCLICRDVWEGRDWEELLESGDVYIVDNGKFICPLCVPQFERIPIEDQITKYGICVCRREGE